MMENILSNWYSPHDLDCLSELVDKPPLYTTIRVNTLKCTRENARNLICEYFESRGEPFVVEDSVDFEDVLMIKAIGPCVVIPAAKGIFNSTVLLFKYIRNRR
jgi:hypothetical protein